MNRYIFDREKKISYVESNEMKCCQCEKAFVEGDYVYFGSGSTRIKCEDCAKYGKGISTDALLDPLGFRPANIKEV